METATRKSRAAIRHVTSHLPCRANSPVVLSPDMSRTRHRRHVALVIAIALLMQALFTAELLAAIAKDSGTARFVTLCTGDRLKRNILSAENRPVHPSYPRHYCLECVLTVAATLSTEAEPAIQLISGRATHQLLRIVRITRHQPRIPPSRAPPTSQRP